MNNNLLYFAPRVIRLRDAPTYLGMKKGFFNQTVRPKLSPIKIGKRGIGFDRLDLDAWIAHHKRADSRSISDPGEIIWDEKERQGSLKERGNGILTSKSLENEFAKAVGQVTSQKQSTT